MLYTIGWERRPLSDFVGALQAAGVDALIDIRLRNTSHLAGYTKRGDLEFLLTAGFGIAYEHLLELAPTPDILDAYRQDHDWDAFAASFASLLVEREAAAVGEQLLARYQAPCLMCYELQPESCHRSLVATLWVDRIPGLAVEHLV